MKKLIIVCEDKLKKYGDFLSQLVSLEDDTTENVRGVKDGEVKAQVWTEKIYSDSAATISSDQYIIFIGNSKLDKEKRSHMLLKHSEYGMKYMWLGKQAALFLDKKIETIDEYERFIDYAKGNESDVSLLIERKHLPETVVEDENRKPNLLDSIKLIPKKISDQQNKVVDSISFKSNAKAIEDQQYTCAVLMFYLKGLSNFLGLTHE